MTVFEELVDELQVDNLIDQSGLDRTPATEQPSGSDTTFDHQPEDLARQKARAEENFAGIKTIEGIFDDLVADPSKSDASNAFAGDARNALDTILEFNGDAADVRVLKARVELAQALAGWQNELQQRDSGIEVSRLRLYCENALPPLGATSLIALSGLYRMAALTNEVRDKFDFLMTRLFSFEPDEVKRELRFGRSETIDQIKKLYRKWDVRDFDSADREKIIEAVEKFAHFGARADAAPTFADLFRTDLPASIREYKKSLGETFFEPEVLASVLDCNVRIGNRFVEIAAVEKQAYGPDAVRAKYGDAYDHVATESAVRTLRLAELLESGDLMPEQGAIPIEIKADPVYAVQPIAHRGSRSGILRGVNKLLLAGTIFAVIAGAAAFFLIDIDTGTGAGTAEAKPADLGTSSLAKYLSNARTTESTLYLSAKPEWDGLTPEEKKKLLNSAFEEARKRSMRNVHILGKGGTRIAFASNYRQELTER